MVSCSSEDSASNRSELISVTENYYRGNQQLFYSKKMNFRGHKIINIEEQNGDHTDFEYNDKNLLSKYQTYSANPNFNETRTYQYDNQGRITTIQRKTQFQNEKYTANFKFTYEPGRILLFQDNVPVKELGLDNNNKIISDKWLTVNMGYHTVFSYSNGNLIHFGPNTEVPQDQHPLTSAYTYTNYKNDFSYQKHLFGKEWKKTFVLIILPEQTPSRHCLKTPRKKQFQNTV